MISIQFYWPIKIFHNSFLKKWLRSYTIAILLFSKKIPTYHLFLKYIEYVSITFDILDQIIVIYTQHLIMKNESLSMQLQLDISLFSVKWYAIFKSKNLPKLKNSTIACYFHANNQSYQLPFHYFHKPRLYICHMSEHILNHIFCMYIDL